MATYNRCYGYQVPTNGDGFVELSRPVDLESQCSSFERLEVNDSNKATKYHRYDPMSDDDSSTASSFPERLDAFELQRQVQSMKKQLDTKDDVIDLMMNKLNDLAITHPDLRGCSCQSRLIEDCHRVPDISQELPYFEGIETQKMAQEWINKLIEIKRQKHWNDDFTLEVATYYLLGEALTWAESIDAVSWKQFQDDFMKNYVYQDQNDQVTIDKIGKFLGYRDTHLVEMSQRKVITDLDGKLEPVNFFGKFMNQAEAEEKRSTALKQQRLPDMVANERSSIYLLVRSPVVKMREIGLLNMKEAVQQLEEQTMQLPPGYFLVPESDNVGKGPFSKRSKIANKSLINEICMPGHRNSWYEWWMHLFLEDKITSKKPSLLNSKPVLVNKQSMKALVDLGAEHCTIQYTVAVKKGLDIVSTSKSIGAYNDATSMVKSLGYVDARLCIQPLSLHGKAKLWIVPDGSQPEEVIIGESLLRSPIIYREEEVGKEELSDWLDLEDLVFEKTSQLQEKDLY